MNVTSAWPSYPGYRIDVLPLEGIGRATIDGRVVAESSRCLLVRESDHRDQLYFPRHDLVADAFAVSDHRTICPFKGEAHWATPAGGGPNVLWWYPEPMAEVAGIAGHAAFSFDLVEVTVTVPFRDGDGATARFPIWGTVGDLAGLMDPRSNGDGTFVAPTYPDPPLGSFIKMAWHGQRRNVVEGGQILGAAIAAAASCRPDQRVSSAHLAFVKAASFDEPLLLRVDERRRGRSLSVFDVDVEQAGALRATGIVMTDAATDDLIRHVEPMPDVPPPAACTPYDFGVLGRELRFVDGAYSLDPQPAGPPVLYTWTRFADAPATPALQLALLAQATTHYAINAAMRPHPEVTEGDAHRTISTGPVNATIAFHDDVDITDWLLTETRAIWAGRGSTHSQVRVFTRDGHLAASKSVQAIVRSFTRSPEQLGQDYATAM